MVPAVNIHVISYNAAFKDGHIWARNCVKFSREQVTEAAALDWFYDMKFGRFFPDDPTQIRQILASFGDYSDAKYLHSRLNGLARTH